jgi:hypothetical protein
LEEGQAYIAVNQSFFYCLDKDVRKIFPDAKSVNNALRTLISLIPQNQNNFMRLA